jgi:putative transcriptional regulator
MGEFGEELIKSMQQAAAHAGGRKISGVRVTTVKIPDVKAIRKALHMSQHRFAALYRIPLPTLKNCEQDKPSICHEAAIEQNNNDFVES